MILVTGGTGAMGSVLVRRLVDKGKQVRVLTLPNDPLAKGIANENVEIRYGDVADAGSIRGICKDIDTIYHLAAVIIAFDDRKYQSINVGGTRNIIEDAKRHAVRHFIHISSASVTYEKTTAYSRSKRETETIVKESGIRWTIVRPTLVYDKKGGQEFSEFLNYLKKFPIIPFIGDGKSLKRPVFVDDLIDGLIALCENSKVVGKVYNLSGGEAISINDFSRLCLRLMGMENKPVIHLPVWLCMFLSSMMGLVMKRPPLRWPVIAGIIQDANLDPSLAIQEIGYSPAKVSDMLPQCFPRN